MSANSSSEKGNNSPRRVCIGKITTAHGVRGLVKILPFCQDTDLLSNTLFTSEHGQSHIDVLIKSSSGKYLIAAITNSVSRDDALALSGTELWISRNILPELNNDEYYFEDLLGLKVETVDGQNIGIVKSINNFGAGDLLEIQPPGNQSFFITFTKENVPDIKDDKVIVNLPDES